MEIFKGQLMYGIVDHFIKIAKIESKKLCTFSSEKEK